jgi:hypothetical protein
MAQIVPIAECTRCPWLSVHCLIDHRRRGTELDTVRRHQAERGQSIVRPLSCTPVHRRPVSNSRRYPCSNQREPAHRTASWPALHRGLSPAYSAAGAERTRRPAQRQSRSVRTASCPSPVALDRAGPAQNSGPSIHVHVQARTQTQTAHAAYAQCDGSLAPTGMSHRVALGNMSASGPSVTLRIVRHCENTC